MNDMNKFPQWHLVPAAAVICGLLLPLSGLAAGSESDLATPLGSPQIFNLGGGLLFVIMAIVGLGVLYAKTQGLKTGSDGVINIIATQAIGPKERIAIVEVSDKQLLIGMTTSSVQTLHVFDEPVVAAPEPKASFSERLKNAMRGGEQ
jgi:flagellar protein FliO/FliZ